VSCRDCLALRRTHISDVAEKRVKSQNVDTHEEKKNNFRCVCSKGKGKRKDEAIPVTGCGGP
jgi:hypothetical protein